MIVKIDSRSMVDKLQAGDTIFDPATNEKYTIEEIGEQYLIIAHAVGGLSMKVIYFSAIVAQGWLWEKKQVSEKA